MLGESGRRKALNALPRLGRRACRGSMLDESMVVVGRGTLHVMIFTSFGPWPFRWVERVGGRNGVAETKGLQRRGGEAEEGKEGCNRRGNSR